MSGLIAVVAVAGVVLTRDDGHDDVAPMNTDDSSPTDTGPVKGQELAAAESTALGNELWIFGGVSGPDGSEPFPPVSGMMPEGFDANATVVQYDSDGVLRRHVTLPDLGDRRLVGGGVVAHGDERFLISNLCNRALCSYTEPALFRIGASSATRIPMVIPGTDDLSPLRSHLEIAGQSSDGQVFMILWSSGWTGEASTSSLDIPQDAQRLLALDPSTGQALVIDPPAGRVEQNSVCVSGHGLFMIETGPDPYTVSHLRIWSRPASTDSADWELVAEIDPIETAFWAGALDCPASGEIFLFLDVARDAEELGARLNVVRTYSTTGTTISDVTLPGDWTRVAFVGSEGERSFAVAHKRFVSQQLMIHETGGGWTLVGPEMPPESRPVILDGQLRDARLAIASVNPDGVELPRIEIPGDG